MLKRNVTIVFGLLATITTITVMFYMSSLLAVVNNQILYLQTTDFHLSNNENSIESEDTKKKQKELKSLQKTSLKHCKDNTEITIDDLVSNRKFRDHLIYNDEYKIIYCNIPKIGSTRWKQNMVILEGNTQYKDPLDIPSNFVHYHSKLQRLKDPNLTEEEIRYKLKNYFKFIFVRHPLERLLSAWRNKFLMDNGDARAFKKNFGKTMMKTVRGTENVDENGNGLMFQEFLAYLTLTNPNHFQEHWALYSDLCHPCAVDYDFVGYFDQLPEDSNFILEKIGAPSITLFDKEEVKSSTMFLLENYLRTVDPIILDHLIDVYKRDYMYFNFSYGVS